MQSIYLLNTGINETIFSINLPKNIKFGFGASKEVGFEAKKLGLKEVLLVVGERLYNSKLFEDVKYSLENKDIKVHVLNRVRIEPEDEEILNSYREIKNLRIDGFVALGGGSTIDTTKALNLLYTYPSDLMDYVNKPVGKSLHPPGDLKPMIAIPTTGGTGSETTSVLVLDIKKLKIKTGISNPYIRPTVALIDPLTTVTVPPMVTASTGLDVLNHAIESYTAKPYTAKPMVNNPEERPVYAGSTPLSEIFGIAAIEYVLRYLKRAVANPYDLEARYYLMLASSIAGIGFGHAGTHLPHAMAYPIAGMVERWYPEDYEFGYPIAPHGIATAIPAAYAFNFLALYDEERFYNVTSLFDSNVNFGEVPEVIKESYLNLLENLRIPTTLKELGFSKENLEALVNGTMAQQRLLSLSPKNVTKKDVEKIFLEAIG
jgi:Alcohol dehydrogenase, class IV